MEIVNVYIFNTLANLPADGETPGESRVAKPVCLTTANFVTSHKSLQSVNEMKMILRN